MDKAKGLGMQGLPGAKFEAVLDELAVFGVDRAFADFRPAIALVVEQGMAYVAHVDPDLVGPSGLQATFHHCDITESFEDLVMGYSVFRPLVIFRDRP